MVQAYLGMFSKCVSIFLLCFLLNLFVFKLFSNAFEIQDSITISCADLPSGASQCRSNTDDTSLPLEYEQKFHLTEDITKHVEDTTKDGGKTIPDAEYNFANEFTNALSEVEKETSPALYINGFRIEKGDSQEEDVNINELRDKAILEANRDNVAFFATGFEVEEDEYVKGQQVLLNFMNSFSGVMLHCNNPVYEAPLGQEFRINLRDNSTDPNVVRNDLFTAFLNQMPPSNSVPYFQVTEINTNNNLAADASVVCASEGRYTMEFLVYVSFGFDLRSASHICTAQSVCTRNTANTDPNDFRVRFYKRPLNYLSTTSSVVCCDCTTTTTTTNPSNSSPISITNTLSLNNDAAQSTNTSVPVLYLTNTQNAAVPSVVAVVPTNVYNPTVTSPSVQTPSAVTLPMPTFPVATTGMLIPNAITPGFPSTGAVIPNAVTPGFPSNGVVISNAFPPGLPSNGFIIPNGVTSGFPSNGIVIPNGVNPGFPSTGAVIPNGVNSGFPSTGVLIPNGVSSGVGSTGVLIPNGVSSGVGSTGFLVPNGVSTGVGSTGVLVPNGVSTGVGSTGILVPNGVSTGVGSTGVLVPNGVSTGVGSTGVLVPNGVSTGVGSTGVLVPNGIASGFRPITSGTYPAYGGAFPTNYGITANPVGSPTYVIGSNPAVPVSANPNIMAIPTVFHDAAPLTEDLSLSSSKDASPSIIDDSIYEDSEIFPSLFTDNRTNSGRAAPVIQCQNKRFKGRVGEKIEYAIVPYETLAALSVNTKEDTNLVAVISDPDSSKVKIEVQEVYTKEKNYVPQSTVSQTHKCLSEGVEKKFYFIVAIDETNNVATQACAATLECTRNRPPVVRCKSGNAPLLKKASIGEVITINLEGLDNELFAVTDDDSNNNSIRVAIQSAEDKRIIFFLNGVCTKATNATEKIIITPYDAEDEGIPVICPVSIVCQNNLS